MLKLTKARPHALLDFAAEPCRMDRWPSDADPIGIVDANGTLRAVSVLCGFTDTSAEWHFASDRRKGFASRAVLRAVFGHAFEEHGLSRLDAHVAESNVTAITGALRMGFRFAGRIEGGFGGDENAILLTMLTQQCPWIAPRSEPED